MLAAVDTGRIFSFRDGKLIGKYTYAQTRLPLFRRGG
jgi:hypothetical protein